MPISDFSLRSAFSESSCGVVCLGGELRPDTLLAAYRNGIFPWPMEGLPLPWCCPPRRGILDLAELHLPRSLRQRIGRQPFRFTIDAAFPAVIAACAAMRRPGRSGTWITPDMKRAYLELHRRGAAHSVEAWEGDLLAGGLYGVDPGGAFCGESMFFLRPYASKLALIFLIEHLRCRGLDWIDIQMLTPHLEAIGAKEIPREAFLQRLRETLARKLVLF